MQVAGVLQQSGQVDLLAVTFEHAVGDEEQTVTGTQVEVLHTVGVGRELGQPEGMVHLAGDHLRSPLAHAQWPGMAGIDELGLTGSEMDTQQLPRGVTVAVCDQRMVGPVGLLGQARPGATGAAQGAHQDRGGQGGIDVVAHGVGHRHMQGVAVQGVVEGVTAEAFGGLQAPAERELRRLARQ